MNTIKLHNIDKNFDQKILFSNLNTEFNSDGINIILGKNGVGKTTLLKIISNLISYESGEIYFSIENPRIFYMPEIPEMFLHAKVQDFLSTVQFFYQNVNTKFNQELLFLSSLLNKKIVNLSTGENKKVLLAAAMLSKADIVLMDEPSNGIDSDFKKQFRDIFNQFIKRNQIVCITTHLVEDFQQLKTNIFYINDGGITENYRPALHNCKIEVESLDQEFLKKILHNELFFCEFFSTNEGSTIIKFKNKNDEFFKKIIEKLWHEEIKILFFEQKIGNKNDDENKIFN